LVIYSKEFVLQSDFLKHFLLRKKDQWRLMAFNARRHFSLFLIKRSMAFNVFALMTMGINRGIREQVVLSLNKSFIKG